MKKRILALLMAAMMCASVLTACSSEEKPSTENNNAPVETPAETPTKEVALDEIVSTVKDAYGENYIPSIQIPSDMAPAEMLSDVYGITLDDCEEYFAEIPMMSSHIDTFIVLKAKEGKVESLTSELKAYLDTQKNDAMCYPENLIRIQGAQVFNVGDYAIYMMLGGFADMDASEEDALKFIEEQVQIGVDAVNALFA